MTSITDAFYTKGIAFEENAPLSERTTLRVGGAARYLVEAADAAQITQTRRIAEEFGLPFIVIGNGSNLLVRDEGFAGVVVVIGPKMGEISCEGTLLRVGAGASLIAAAAAAQRAQLSGMEPLSGIPGTCGGAVYMNAGAYGGEVAAILREATLLSVGGEVYTVPSEALGLSYRRSRLMETGEIVLEALFALTPGDGGQIAASMRELAAKRREKQPVTLPSAGSFFKRPEGNFAAALIDQAGLKGLRVGGAEVSRLHAGFLVNVGGATAGDFIALADLVKERVYAQSGIILEPEVRIL